MVVGEFFLRVQFLLKKIVVLFVVFLDVSSELTSMSTFEFVHELVVLLELFDLLFELGHFGLKASLGVSDFGGEGSDTVVIGLLLLFLFIEGAALELLEDLLAVAFFFVMCVLEGFHLVCDVSLFLEFVNGLLVLSDSVVCVSEDAFDFLFVGVGECLVVVRVFFVFGMKVENDLGELGHLFAHFVVDVGDAFCHRSFLTF